MPQLKPTRGIRLNRSHPFSRGLVGLWLFNEGSGGQVFDLSGNGNNGILVNSPIWVSGIEGSALNFIPNLSYVTIPYSTSLAIANNLTIVTKIYTTTSTSNEGIVAGKGTSDYVIGVLSGGAKIFFQIKEGAHPYISADFTKGGWTHIACVLDKSNNGEIFIDSISKASGALTAIVPNATGYMFGTYEEEGLNVGLDGFISYVIIYNRALSASEIALLYREPFCMVQKKAAPVYFFVPTGIGELDAEITENATAEDEVSCTGIFLSAVVEIVSVGDAANGLRILTTEITESAAATEVTDSSRVQSSTITEAANATDIQSCLLIKYAEITEAATAEDETSVIGIFLSAVTEAANATDESSAFLGDEAEITESTAATEATDRSRVQSSTITEAANATEIEDTVIIEYEAEITEAATAEDEVSVAGIFPVTVTEAANATDAEDAIPSVQDAEITEVAEAADTQESYRVYTDIPPFMEKDLIDPWASGAWLWLVEIAVPAKDTVRIARNTADVRYGGIDYEKFNLQIGEQVFSGDGSIPRVTLRTFQDPTREIETIINETEGALGATVKLIRVNEKFLDVPVNALEADYDLLASESDSEWCTVTLGIPNPLTQRFPLEDFSSSVCPWTSPALFKGPKCQYDGDDPTCTGTYEDCYVKGNAARWGGELGLSPSVTKERR